MNPSPQPSRSDEPVPPHAPLGRYYDADAERHRYVIDLFNQTAQHYNTVEALFLNGGLLYRRLSLRLAGLRRGMHVLDVAIGTAAVARGAARIVGPEGRVYGVDPSSGMLGQARRHFRGPLTQGVAEALPFASDRFDFVTMGIALRHVSDLVATFREYLRVLRPGGRLWILEGHVPRSALGHKLTRFVWARVIPLLGHRRAVCCTRDDPARHASGRLRVPALQGGGAWSLLRVHGREGRRSGIRVRLKRSTGGRS
jgi:demethylmenaquinone methyltransferase/2-methoxy-6-polyprenyl-1,4-benzoquinol methylase